jgi:hypothetical protein
MLPALDGAKGDRIGNEPRFEARFDPEESPDLLQHRHLLTPERLSGGIAPFWT